MILTDQEKQMRDGAEGAATAAAMDLLIRYGYALACDRLCGQFRLVRLLPEHRLLGTAPVAMIITRLSTKSALGAVLRESAP